MLESMMGKLQSTAHTALNTVRDEAQGREAELTKLHEAQIAELQARAPSTFGAGDRALEDAKAENERLATYKPMTQSRIVDLSTRRGLNLC